MEQSPFRESYIARLVEVFPVFCNLRVDYSVQGIAPLVAILSHINSLCTLLSYFIYIPVTLYYALSNSRSPKWSSSFSFCDKNCVCISNLSQA